MRRLSTAALGIALLVLTLAPATANAQQFGTIIVEKQTDPDGAPDAFTFTGDVAGAIPDGGQIVVTNLAPGTYTSTETVPVRSFTVE